MSLLDTPSRRVKFRKQKGPCWICFRGFLPISHTLFPCPLMSPMSFSFVSDSSQLMINPNHSLFLVQELPTFKIWDRHIEMLLLLPYYISHLSQKLFLLFLQPLCSCNISVLGCDCLHHLTDMAHLAYSWRPPRGRMASMGEGHKKSSKSQAAAAFVLQITVRTPAITCGRFLTYAVGRIGRMELQVMTVALDLRPLLINHLLKH